MALDLLFEVGGQHTATVNDAIFIPEGDAVITASDDKCVQSGLLLLLLLLFLVVMLMLVLVLVLDAAGMC